MLNKPKQIPNFGRAVETLPPDRPEVPITGDEDDYSDMQIEQIDIGNFTITAISEVRHLQDGTTNIINAGVDFYLSGGGVDGVAAGTSNSNRMRIEANKEGSGSYVIDSNIYFPQGMFRVYN